jgi:8-oxo-(d)GTP phosphatase
MAEQPADLPPAVIRAAGAVLWRPGAEGPEVALVHRPRYGDWSLPKGKSLPGEHVLLTAVREVAEETGTRVTLGRRLPSARYDQGGRPKVVDYWAARAADGPQPGFRPSGEVDRLDWLGVSAARDRLSYPGEAAVLDEFATGPPDTFPFILVRHASAGSKKGWRASGHADDLLRPLDATGQHQAAALAPLLGCYAAGRVLSSVAERCLATMRPYAARAARQVQGDRAFTVSLTSGAQTRNRIDELVSAERPAAVCGHRENLPMLLEEACAVLGAKPPEGKPLPMAGFWVLHVGWSALITAERHHALPERPA